LVERIVELYFRKRLHLVVLNRWSILSCPRANVPVAVPHSGFAKRIAPWIAAVAVWTALASPVAGQFQELPPEEATPGHEVVRLWRIGMIVVAEGGGFRGIKGTVAVPMDWPEQRVRVVRSDLSPDVTVRYETIKETARQMIVAIPALRSGEQAKAIVTFEVRRLLQQAPENPGVFSLPAAKRSDPKLAPFLRPSPYIESTAPEIVEAARKIGVDKSSVWEQVEAVYDWVREKIEYEDNRGETVKGAVAALNDGRGDCDEMTSLFIALCRAKGIPARTVRVPGHCYPEFYLVDPGGTGRWFPCQAAGTRAFGSMPDPRPVLQKGDNILAFDPKTKKKAPVRFLPETLVGMPTSAGGRLQWKLICEPARE